MSKANLTKNNQISTGHGKNNDKDSDTAMSGEEEPDDFEEFPVARAVSRERKMGGRLVNHVCVVLAQEDTTIQIKLAEFTAYQDDLWDLSMPGATRKQAKTKHV